MRVIGVGGELESGKDTFSDFMVTEYSYTKMAFADNLKHMCMEVFGLTHDQCYTTAGKFKEFEQPFSLTTADGFAIIKWLMECTSWERPISGANFFMVGHICGKGKSFHSPREVLQFVGTEIMRDCFHPDIHAIMLFKEARLNSIEKLVICDCRFDNERKSVKGEKGDLVLVENPEVKAEEEKSTHRSETSLGSPEEYDVVMINDKTLGLEKFHNKIKFTMEKRV